MDSTEDGPLVSLPLRQFIYSLGSRSSVPGGGSAAAAMAAMVSIKIYHSPLSHGGHIVPGDQESFVLPRQASPPWFPLRGLAW